MLPERTKAQLTVAYVPVICLPLIVAVTRTGKLQSEVLRGGLAVNAARHMTFDVGYKYSAIAIDTDYLQSGASPRSHTRINAHKMHAGIGVTF
jgi:hypothetical protein